MSKLNIITLALLTLLAACGTKTSTPDPEPEEYFSFYADGEFFNYPQIYESWGGGRTLKAYKVGTTQFKIEAYDKAASPARGRISIYFPGAHIPDQDTVILTSAGISNFIKMENNFEIHSPLKGKIIFSERSLTKLTGTFEFEAYHINYDGTLTGKIITDTIISITQGKFCIKL